MLGFFGFLFPKDGLFTEVHFGDFCKYTAFQPSNLKMYSSWVHFPVILGTVMTEKVKSNSKIPHAHSAFFCYIF